MSRPLPVQGRKPAHVAGHIAQPLKAQQHPPQPTG
jgi:hypothetical protein